MFDVHQQKSEKYEAIVIGAGMGGSVAAALLANRSMKTLLLEKNENVGGTCSWYEKEGFKLDSCVHTFAFCENGFMYDALKKIGMENEVKFVHMSPVFKVGNFELRLPIPFASDADDFILRIDDILKEMGMTTGEVFPGNQKSELKRLISDLWNFTPEQTRSIDDVDVMTFLCGYELNLSIFFMLAYLDGLYAVELPWENSAGEFVRCFQVMFRELKHGYTEGGASAIPEAFAKYIMQSGGTVLTHAEVSKIAVENGKAKGVELKDGRKFSSDIVVSTTGVKETVFNLIGEEHFPDEYMKKAKDVKHSLSAVLLRIALDEKVTDDPVIVGMPLGNLDLNGLAKIASDLGLFNLTLPVLVNSLELIGVSREDLSDAFKMAFFGGAFLDVLPGVMPIYAPVISNYDPNLAPKGKQLIQTCTAASLRYNMRPWEKWVEAVYNATCDMIPGLREHTLWYDSATPEDLEKFLGKEDGPAFSTAQVIGQIGDGRFQNKSPIGGLYFAGDNAGGWGIGVELATKSAIECVNAIGANT